MQQDTIHLKGEEHLPQRMTGGVLDDSFRIGSCSIKFVDCFIK